MRKTLMLLFCIFLLMNCGNKNDFNPEWTSEKAPETFVARFETTKGNFEITAQRQYSPLAADRFYQLVKHGYYDNAIFYRVVDKFVAQFGNTDTLMANRWRTVKIPDEPLKLGNQKGTVSFARFGKESRDLEVFINLEDNPVLDTLELQNLKGFPAFGNVTKGMDVVEKLYSGYGETPMGDPDLYTSRSKFKRSFPMLDVIKKASITGE